MMTYSTVSETDDSGDIPKDYAVTIGVAIIAEVVARGGLYKLS
jgi:hypothetical protein